MHFVNVTFIGGVAGSSDLGKRKNRWDDEGGDASKPLGFSGGQDLMSVAMNITAGCK